MSCDTADREVALKTGEKICRKTRILAQTIRDVLTRRISRSLVARASPYDRRLTHPSAWMKNAEVASLTMG